MSKQEQNSHFGFQSVAKKDKQKLVQGVFSRVADNYDLMNDLMSLGLHRWWKSEFMAEIPPYHGASLLDVAGGTGDIARQFIEAGEDKRGIHATVCDLNQEMLEQGKRKLAGHKVGRKIAWVHANGEDLPFIDNSFEYYSISFGIRNFTNIEAALKEAYRVLQPGGKFACLEFSNVRPGLIAKIYDLYSFQIIPKIGEMVAGDKAAYQYLVESIRKFPKAPAFATMMEDVGFTGVTFRKLTFGVVAIHVGYKPL